jgi:CRP/FNR family transcriptional regulator, cyclic AMP receptor protein
MRTIEQLISEVPLFEGLADSDLEVIAGCGTNVSFEADDVLFREGDPASTFYVVRHGRVALQIPLTNAPAITITTVEPGEVVGWSWLFPPHRDRFDAVALTAVRATAFDGECLRGKCERDAKLGYALMSRFAQVLIERLQWTRLQLLDVYGRRTVS